MMECSVSLRMLTLTEINRMAVNPFLVTKRCGRCTGKLTKGPKCDICGALYHYYCSKLKKTCCWKKIIEKEPEITTCTICSKNVMYGPQCNQCNAVYHPHCVNGYFRCCFQLLVKRENAKICSVCKREALMGPTCQRCKSTYHNRCSVVVSKCCDVALTANDSQSMCRICRRYITLPAPICQYCGEVSHMGCWKRSKMKCSCGKMGSTEVFFVSGIQQHRKSEVKGVSDASPAEEPASSTIVDAGPPVLSPVNPSTSKQKDSTKFRIISDDVIQVATIKVEPPEQDDQSSTTMNVVEDPQTSTLEPPVLTSSNLISPNDSKNVHPPVLEPQIDEHSSKKSTKVPSQVKKLPIAKKKKLPRKIIPKKHSTASKLNMLLQHLTKPKGISASRVVPSLRTVTTRSVAAAQQRQNQQQQQQNSTNKVTTRAEVTQNPQPGPSSSYSLDHIRIVDVKTESDGSNDGPRIGQPSTDSGIASLRSVSETEPEDSVDALKGLFDYLHQVVKKFPTPVQTQVKLHIFNFVTEVELKIQNGQLPRST